MFRKFPFHVALSASVLATAGCSSEPQPETKNSTSCASAAPKTCADVAKCCARIGEPRGKAACTALTSGKVEAACAASHDDVCGGADDAPQAGFVGVADPGPTCARVGESCGLCCDDLECKRVGGSFSARCTKPE